MLESAEGISMDASNAIVMKKPKGNKASDVYSTAREIYFHLISIPKSKIPSCSERQLCMALEFILAFRAMLCV